MRVLVTGASGFVGKRLCQFLEARGHSVIRVHRDKKLSQYIEVDDVGPATDWRRSIGFGASFLNGQVPDNQALPEDGMKLSLDARSLNVAGARSDRNGRLDTVIHLAARVHVMKEDAAEPLTEFRRVNVEGTLNLAEQAVAAGIKRFVYVSSIKVNGESAEPGRPFHADDPPVPHDAYAISKYEGEIGLRTLAQDTGLEVVIVRPPIVYGPGVKGNFATLVKWVRNGIPLPLGAVRNRRSLVALDNLVDFIALCADRDKSPQAANQVFLISDGDDVSTSDLLRKVALAYGVRSHLIPVPESWLYVTARLSGRTAVADRLLGSLVVDISKARELLGWNPIVTMDQQLRKMADDVVLS